MGISSSDMGGKIKGKMNDDKAKVRPLSCKARHHCILFMKQGVDEGKLGNIEKKKDYAERKDQI